MLRKSSCRFPAGREASSETARRMPRKRKVHVTKVTAFLPYSVDLTKLKSNNTLDIEVRSGEELLGRLLMGRGSVQWWPSGNKHCFACVIPRQANLFHLPISFGPPRRRLALTA